MTDYRHSYEGQDGALFMAARPATAVCGFRYDPTTYTLFAARTETGDAILTGEACPACAAEIDKRFGRSPLGPIEHW